MELDSKDLIDVAMASAEDQAYLVTGILCTDSRGGYDAVEVNESPLLGLSNMRAALQAFQPRDNLKRVGCELRWLASAYDLFTIGLRTEVSAKPLLEHCVWRMIPTLLQPKATRRLAKLQFRRLMTPLVICLHLCHHMVLLKIFSEHAFAIFARELQLQDLQQDLAINAGSLHVHAITAGSGQGQVGTTCFGTLSPCEYFCTAVADDQSPFRTGAATDTCATDNCQS